MYKTLLTEIQTNVRHLPLNVEKQDIADLQISASHRSKFLPQSGGRTGHRPARYRVRITDETATIKAGRCTAAIPVRDSDLADRYLRGVLAYCPALNRASIASRFCHRNRPY